MLIKAFNFIIFSGSRGAVFSLIVYIFILTMVKLKNNFLKTIYTILIIIGSYLILANLEQIIFRTALFLSSYGVDVQWLERSIRQMNSTEVGILSGRTDLYYGAIELIKQAPILGIGVGEYDSVYGIYPHNLILDLLCNFGVIGASVFLFVIICGFYKSFNTNENVKFISLLLFSLSIPQLMFSNSFWLSNTFWMYFILSLSLLGGKYWGKMRGSLGDF
ncbi:O-antigen ligase family protein [Rossellomorea marisflavi]|uniref:O-antigen ligase family protein n=1 Tax=Rossellomorea marisflavi TaxID=189381 RepID=UPI001652C904|nr:O-antigen ligase family protein [Rossellomorea marisflavi]